MKEQISAACQTAMPMGEQEPSSSYSSSRTACSSTGTSADLPSGADETSDIQVVFTPDEELMRVTVTFLRRNCRSQGQGALGRAQQTLSAVLQQEEAERKFSSPDRPSEELAETSKIEGPGAAASAGAPAPGDDIVLRELREGVVTLTERAACLEGPDGASDNQPEVRKVRSSRPTSLLPHCDQVHSDLTDGVQIGTLLAYLRWKPQHVHKSTRPCFWLLLSTWVHVCL